MRNRVALYVRTCMVPANLLRNTALAGGVTEDLLRTRPTVLGAGVESPVAVPPFTPSFTSPFTRFGGVLF